MYLLDKKVYFEEFDFALDHTSLNMLTMLEWFYDGISTINVKMWAGGLEKIAFKSITEVQEFLTRQQFNEADIIVKGKSDKVKKVVQLFWLPRRVICG